MNVAVVTSDQIHELSLRVFDWICSGVGTDCEEIAQRFGLSRWLSVDIVDRLVATGELEWAMIDAE